MTPMRRSSSTPKAAISTPTMSRRDRPGRVGVGRTVAHGPPRRAVPPGRSASRSRAGVQATIRWPRPIVSKPLAVSRSARSAGSSAAGVTHTWGWRPSVAKRARTSTSRRSKAAGSAGQRTASSRFQNGSASVGSWRSRLSSRSSRTRPGMAWTSASWRSRIRTRSASMAGGIGEGYAKPAGATATYLTASHRSTTPGGPPGGPDHARDDEEIDRYDPTTTARRPRPGRRPWPGRLFRLGRHDRPDDRPPPMPQPARPPANRRPPVRAPRPPRPARST